MSTSREISQLYRLLNTPSLPQLTVRVRLVGEVTLIATGPGPMDRTVITIQQADGETDLLQYAPQSWFINNTSLLTAVHNGWIDVVDEPVAVAAPSPQVAPLSLAAILVAKDRTRVAQTGILNFAGVLTDVVHDPETGVTTITVSGSGGGGDPLVVKSDDNEVEDEASTLNFTGGLEAEQTAPGSVDVFLSPVIEVLDFVNDIGPEV